MRNLPQSSLSSETSSIYSLVCGLMFPTPCSHYRSPGLQSHACQHLLRRVHHLQGGVLGNVLPQLLSVRPRLVSSSRQRSPGGSLQGAHGRVGYLWVRNVSGCSLNFYIIHKNVSYLFKNDCHITYNRFINMNFTIT
jgi:hypothetical protein